MNELRQRLRQFRGLGRLREMERTRAATTLSDRNKALAEAEAAFDEARALYRRTVDAFSQERTGGTFIDPQRIGYQLAAAEAMHRRAQEGLLARRSAVAARDVARVLLADSHLRRKVVQTAIDATHERMRAARQAFDALESQDQAARAAIGDPRP